MELIKYLDDFNERDWQYTSEGTVRLALVGLGWWTVDMVLPAVKDSDLCCTTTVVSSSKNKAEKTASSEATIEHAITYEEFHDGEAKEAFDAVYIATPNARHLEYAETAAKLGKDVLCEKPMEATAERAQRLVSVCDSNDVLLMIAYRVQTQPAIRRARELIDNGFIGKPVQAYGSYSQPLLGMFSNPDQWRLDSDLSGYGTSIMDLGIYPINTLRFLLRSDPTAVTAQTESFHEDFSDVSDERSAYTLTFENGTHAVCTASQNAYGDSQLKLTGTDGQIDLSPVFNGECTLELARSNTTVQISFENVDEMKEEFDYFADKILCSGSVFPDGQHGLVDMRTLQAIYRAARSGQVEQIK
ncbi:D-xylose 1-dehydrogenase Gfo6 [Haladaptatus caseinilyticus]|uniref:D-xylose 1-dehydrogenase Gfo6 n=1 Tax=Haladaptatus caseinilyticus TaxID=2993314 RepID=UPI00224A6FC4|nr:D-xylose 1-dehydrogenase Gfo6 [Haladaptatus caseinilyticus]